MPELNSHNSWKQVCNIFLVETKNETQISRKFAGISRKFAGISRKFADICFNHFKTNISGMCGHGPKISRSRLSIFYFHRTNSPNPWRPDLKENEAVGAAIWQNHLSHFVWFYRNFCFPSRFFKPRWSIAFFSCTRVSQVGSFLRGPCMIFYRSLWEDQLAKVLIHSCSKKIFSEAWQRSSWPTR